MNSFSYIGRGIDAAVREQIALHEAGEEVVQETYDYDADRDTLTPHRTKEEAEDYRYFPEPDLVPGRAGGGADRARCGRAARAAGGRGSSRLTARSALDRMGARDNGPRRRARQARGGRASNRGLRPTSFETRQRPSPSRSRPSSRGWSRPATGFLETSTRLQCGERHEGFHRRRVPRARAGVGRRRRWSPRSSGSRRELRPGRGVPRRQGRATGYFVGQVMKETGGTRESEGCQRAHTGAAEARERRSASPRRTRCSPRRATGAAPRPSTRHRCRDACCSRARRSSARLPTPPTSCSMSSGTASRRRPTRHADAHADRAARLVARGPASVQAGIERHRGEDANPPLRAGRRTEEILAGLGEQVGACHRLDEPRLLLEFRLELARPPARVAGEDPCAAVGSGQILEIAVRSTRSRCRRTTIVGRSAGSSNSARTSTASRLHRPADVDTGRPDRPRPPAAGPPRRPSRPKAD